MAVSLVFLLLILTFNAYACVLPLQTTTEMDCDADTDTQARQTCDAFLEIGPQSQFSAHQAVISFHLEAMVPLHVPDAFLAGGAPAPPPCAAGPPVHISIPITVLRI